MGNATNAFGGDQLDIEARFDMAVRMENAICVPPDCAGLESLDVLLMEEESSELDASSVVTVKDGDACKEEASLLMHEVNDDVDLTVDNNDGLMMARMSEVGRDDGMAVVRFDKVGVGEGLTEVQKGEVIVKSLYDQYVSCDGEGGDDDDSHMRCKKKESPPPWLLCLPFFFSTCLVWLTSLTNAIGSSPIQKFLWRLQTFMPLIGCLMQNRQRPSSFSDDTILRNLGYLADPG